MPRVKVTFNIFPSMWSTLLFKQHCPMSYNTANYTTITFVDNVRVTVL